MKHLHTLKHKAKKLQSHRYFNRAGLFLLAFGVIGTVTLLFSSAATPTASFEAEQASLVGGATSISDTSASGGSAVRFGTTAGVLSNFRTGTVLTQDALDPSGNSASIVVGKTLLNNSSHTAAQPIIGFGISNPTTGPGVYDHSELRKRIGDPGATNGSAGGVSEIVLNVNGVPGWMRGRGSQNFGSTPDGKKLYIEDAPFPEFYDGVNGDDIGDWVAATMLANPKIKYIQVWSEMKGFWDATNNRWEIEKYTAMYNNIWDKVRSACSGQPCASVKIGGPYPSITYSSKAGRGYNSTELNGPWGWADRRDLDAVKYWFQNKVGADFITFDMRNHHTYDDEKITPDQLTAIPELVTSPFQRNVVFQDAVNWFRGLNNQTYPGAGTLPIWIAEWYSRWDTPTLEVSIAAQPDQGSIEQRHAVMSDGLIKIVKSGITRALLWGPQGEPGTPGLHHPLALFTDTLVAGGGVATPFHATQKYIHDNFSAGTALVTTNSSNPKITVLASSAKLLMVNTEETNQSTVIDGTTYNFASLQVMRVDR